MDDSPGEEWKPVIIFESLDLSVDLVLLHCRRIQLGYRSKLCLPLEGSGDILFFPLRLSVRLSVCPSQNRVRSLT